ncbi:Sister chromatid cohesion protein DCC1 [Mortierella sp. GBA30]|nr:Sister chromatid cohesion protein DCC1 [Mortierella sp. GBA30]
MANPSTQPPSNATTTDIIFARDFVQSSYTLLELPKSLENYLLENENASNGAPLSFEVRGLEKDTAVLCTETQTFMLQRAHTSNTLIPVAPVLELSKRDLDMDVDMDTDLAIDPYQIDDLTDDSPYKKQAVLDILDSVLDLIPISPRLDRLADVLGRCQFEGHAQESNIKGHLYTWEQLQSIVQASDKEMLQWLKDRHACIIEGHWRLFKRRFMYDILQEILMTMNVLDMSADSVNGTTLCARIEQESPAAESGIEPWMVEHCLGSFSNEEQTTEPGYYHLSAKKMCTFMGIHLLSTIERGNRWKLEEYMNAWQTSLHEHFQADLAYLAGECVVEADRAPERNQSHKYIRYFSKTHLPNDPAARFTALFEIKSKWEGPEIRPFLRDLVLDEKKLDVLLLKHARSVKQAGGGVIYSSRVIK